MSSDQKKFLPINYANREFSEIRGDLLEMAERFYPETFQDFSEASFGAMMIDSVAYVADQLNFYLDYSVNESFLDTSFQLDNVLRHGRVLGYKHSGRPSTFGEVAIYVQVPASDSGLGPDTTYIPILSRGTRFTSKNGLSYMLTENIDFSDPANQIVVAKVNNATGAPTHYAIKSYGSVVSGRLSQQSFSVGGYQRFKALALNNSNIVEIISVYDAEGNQYFEVEYLSQDMVYKEVINSNYKNDNVPSIMKPMLVSRKFIVERSGDGVVLQFGSGDESESDVVANPQNVAIDVFGKNYVTDTTFDPTRLSKNRSYGTVPVNTTLFVTYRTVSPGNSNVAVNSVNAVANLSMNFADPTGLSAAKISEIKQSIEVSNEKPITGVTSNPSTGEIKRRIFDTFPTQNRAVTQADYESLAYRMPGKFGSVKRVTVFKDQDSMKRNLNMYVISEDSFGKLTKTNRTIKNNLKTWLNDYRMINDTIDILDPYIINLGVDFVIRLQNGADKDNTLGLAISHVAAKFSNGFFIGEPMQVSDIYSELKKVEGVMDVVRVKITDKSGGQYSATTFNVNKNMDQDGTQLLAPANAVFEIKYPSVDIKGKIK
tara:strand:+ start:1915 stop:3711 length:1797 start_codon:yes stop_codon:yes gene_type:complete